MIFPHQEPQHNHFCKVPFSLQGNICRFWGLAPDASRRPSFSLPPCPQKAHSQASCEKGCCGQGCWAEHAVSVLLELPPSAVSCLAHPLQASSSAGRSAYAAHLLSIAAYIKGFSCWPASPVPAGGQGGAHRRSSHSTLCRSDQVPLSALKQEQIFIVSLISES